MLRVTLIQPDGEGYSGRRKDTAGQIDPETPPPGDLARESAADQWSHDGCHRVDTAEPGVIQGSRAKGDQSSEDAATRQLVSAVTAGGAAT